MSEQATISYKKEILDKVSEALGKGIQAEKDMNINLKEQELRDIDNLKVNEDKYSYLYPNVLDPQFNIKIVEKREFFDSKYDEQVKEVEGASETACQVEFELAPHQIFVRNFLSFLTPYNGLLLFHGLGTGKTCSAISVCEEMREYMKQMGLKKHIIIIASPKVQKNFKLQLFDERKLKEIDGLWNLRACTGNTFLKEINPMNMKGLERDVIVKQVETIIRQYYKFRGYSQFSNDIQKLHDKYEHIKNKSVRESKIHKNIKKEFSNRLIVVDEVHNIQDVLSRTKMIAKSLTELVQYSDNVKLLLLSATPMFNSYREIISIINLLNVNDKRYRIDIRDIFDKDGNFKLNKKGEQIGLNLFKQKIRGYISFVQGENPYNFPYKIYPKIFDSANSYKKIY